MYFESFSAVLQMDGHGGFVWSAYLITLLVIVYILYAPRRRERRFLRQLEGQVRRNSGAAAPVPKES
ncbi:MAG TPA: heme exporter protein CcmD [Kineobactrum sp.]